MEVTRQRQGSGLPPSKLGTTLACLMMVFLVLLPKGGSRLGGLPLTWGYLLIMVTAPCALVIRLLLLPLRFSRRAVVVTFILLPFQLLSLYAYKFYGISNLPFTFSTFVGLAALPWIFLLVFPPFYPTLDGPKLQRLFRNCIFFAAAWGIFLFFCKPMTGHFVEIPYITVNASDFGELENTKNIARGTVFKLISTYNNGNLYGVATLLLLPMYLRMESSRRRRLVVRLALLLTLSRTVWVGLVLNEVLSLVVNFLGQVRTFPVLFLGAARRRFYAVVAMASFAVISVLYSGISVGLLQFFFDPTGGNRIGQVTVAEQTTSLLPDTPLYGFAEILYASAAQYWGLLGLVSFTMIMLSPLLILFWEPKLMEQPLRRAALKGLVIYIVMGISDGALDFIPVMAFYWFVYAVLLFGWPGMEASRRVAAGTAPELPSPDEGTAGRQGPPLLEQPVAG